MALLSGAEEAAHSTPSSETYDIDSDSTMNELIREAYDSILRSPPPQTDPRMESRTAERHDDSQGTLRDREEDLLDYEVDWDEVFGCNKSYPANSPDQGPSSCISKPDGAARQRNEVLQRLPVEPSHSTHRFAPLSIPQSRHLMQVLQFPWNFRDEFWSLTGLQFRFSRRWVPS